MTSYERQKLVQSCFTLLYLIAAIVCLFAGFDAAAAVLGLVWLVREVLL